MRYVSLFFVLILFGCSRPSPQKQVDPNVLKEFLIQQNIRFSQEEQQYITSYLDSSDWEMTKTTTGLYYQILENGKGKKAQKGDIVHFSACVRLLSGDTVYSKKYLGVQQFEIGHSDQVAGLQEGIILMSESSVARFLIPSHLAYGLTGDLNGVPYRSPIIYDVKLLSINK